VRELFAIGTILFYTILQSFEAKHKEVLYNGKLDEQDVALSTK